MRTLSVALRRRAAKGCRRDTEMLEGNILPARLRLRRSRRGIALFRGRGMTHEPHIIEVDQPVNSPDGRSDQQAAAVLHLDRRHAVRTDPADRPTRWASMPTRQSNGGPIRFHQICMRVEGLGRFLARAKAQDLPVVMWRDIGAATAEVPLPRCARPRSAIISNIPG